MNCLGFQFKLNYDPNRRDYPYCVVYDLLYVGGKYVLHVVSVSAMWSVLEFTYI